MSATKTLQETNIERVQSLVSQFQNGHLAGYLAGVADDFKGSMLGGLVPDGESIESKAELVKVLSSIDQYMAVMKFEPKNWRAYDNDVVFQVSWCFVWKATGVEHETTALVRFVVKDGMICETYYMVDAEAITGEKTPHDATPVTVAKALLDEYMAGNSAGYLAGVSDDFKANILGGLLPGGEAMTSKAELVAVMGEMDKYMAVEKFEPHTFRAMPNNDVLFLVDWSFTWLQTGKKVETTAVVRKVVKDVKLSEMYHMMDAEAIIGAPSPRPAPHRGVPARVATSRLSTRHGGTGATPTALTASRDEAYLVEKAMYASALLDDTDRVLLLIAACRHGWLPQDGARGTAPRVPHPLR